MVEVRSVYVEIGTFRLIFVENGYFMRKLVNFGRNQVSFRRNRAIFIEIRLILASLIDLGSILGRNHVNSRCKTVPGYVEKLGQGELNLSPRVKIVMILESLLMEHLNILKYF